MPRRRLKDAVQTLMDQGYVLPPELHKLTRWADYERRGVVQVWRCPKCSEKSGYVDYESEVRLSGMNCKCGRVMRKIYPK